MRKVLVYVPSLYRLGPAAALLAELPSFGSRGIELHLVTDELAAPNDLECGLEIPVHRCRKDSGDRLWPMKLRKIARKLRVDALHNWCGPAIVDWAWSGLRARRFATVETAAQGTRLLNRRTRTPELLVLQDETANLETPGEFHAGEVSAPCVQTRAKILVSAAGTNPGPGYFNSRFAIPSGSVVAVAAATLEPWARVKDLIWAADLLFCIRDDVHLVIAGTGSQRKKLEHFLRLTDCQSNVHFHGLPADPVAMIRSADLFWQSSPAATGRYAVLTAMSAGVPVIAAAGKNIEGIVQHQQTGLLVPYGSRDGFARWSKYLLEIPEQREQLVTQAETLVNKTDFGTGNLERLFECYEG